jgi:hypothetical protein
MLERLAPAEDRSAASGLSPQDVRHVVVSHLGRLRGCYENEAERNQQLRGQLVARWNIAPDGTVDGVPIVEMDSSLDNTGLRLCIMHEISSWRFPTSKRPSIVKWPFRFGIVSPSADGGAVSAIQSLVPDGGVHAP